MKIPLVDLKANYLSVKKEIDEKIFSVIGDTAFVKGRELDDFEKNWALKCNAECCAGLANGTVSLELILKALGIGPGDEVIVPSHTFIATAEAVANCGAKPVFADCIEKTALIDPESVKSSLNVKTKAVIIVDLYGQPADHNAVKAAAGENVFIIQDAAQSHLASYKNKTVGSYAYATSFSFYPGKNLGAFGDAGAVVTNDRGLCEKIKMLSDHGRMSKYEHLVCGTNARMDNIQAAVLNVKMRHLALWNEKRKKTVDVYKKSLKNSVSFFELEPSAVSSNHLIVIRTPERNDLKRYLEERGISAGIHYPVPLHLQPAFSELGYKTGDLPVTEKIADEILSLPVYPEMTEEQTEYVIENVKKYFRQG